MSNWIAPSQFLRNNKIKVVAGMVLDPQELGMPAHPVFGALPVVTVIDAKDDGSVFLHGEIECSECGETREIEPGDWFQVRRCRTHQKKAQRKAKAVHKTEEEKLAAKTQREAEQAVKNAEREIKRAEEKAAAAMKRAEDAQAKLDLMAKVAAEKGVGISPKTEEKSS
jgi:Na+-translocating ferredoxin:NAD+ oxidoreductase RnfC subunit